ncbi:MAG: glycosyltransferase involved in cell wall biosynthesis [Gammaproteobacteria bacterium]|jgi:glycosyltransferase involved in cell wall biosynthesis
MDYTKSLSIVLPAKNEEQGLIGLLPTLVRLYPAAEIIVVDSGSTDQTGLIATKNGVKVVKQPYSYGNGAAVKAGLRAAQGDIVVLMDADGQHHPEDIKALLKKMDDGFDMVIGARKLQSHASIGRRIANQFYNGLASKVTNHSIKDLTSGFRAIRSELAREFIHLLPNGFSYPTTITMAFLRSGYSVGFTSISAGARAGKSHISPIKDGLRFLLIIFKIGTLYSPLKIFVPISLVHFLTGVCYYAYTYFSFNRLTNMSVILFLVAGLIFMFGLLSEQITSLHYSLRNTRR